MKPKIKSKITRLINKGLSNVEIRDELRSDMPKITTQTIKSRREQYFKGKCDKIVAKLFTGQQCVICLSQGRINTRLTCGHHIVAKSLSAYFRHSIENIICLCPEHHTFGIVIAAHSKYQPAQVVFIDWLKENMPDQYYLLHKYKTLEGVIDYESAYNLLRKYEKQCG
jgi:hypothetical protein